MQNPAKRHSNRKGNLPLIIAVIGIVADVIGVSTFIYNANSPTNANPAFSDSSLIVTFVIMIYSWFVISWHFISRHFESINKDVSPVEVITNTTLGVGILLLPISILIAIVKQEAVFAFLHLPIWFFIFVANRLLLPVFYPSIVKHLSKWREYTVFGKYICQKGYQSWESQEKFRKGDYIQIYAEEDESADYWYRSSRNGGGKI